MSSQPPSAESPSPLIRMGDFLKWVSALLLVLAIMLYAATPILKIIDIGWHIAQGRWMLEHERFYTQDEFNYPNLGHAVIDEYPVFQIITVAVFGVFGEAGLIFLNVVLYGAMAAFLLGAVRQNCTLKIILYTSFIACCFLFIPLAFRPHLATYFGIVFFGIFLLRHRDIKNAREVWPLVLYQILWVNAHSGFILGIVMTLAFSGEMIMRSAWEKWAWPGREIRIWSLAVLFILAACLINPYGWQRLSLPFYQQNLELIRAFVQEMQPLGSEAQTLYDIFVGLALVHLAGLFFLNGRAISWSFSALTILFYLEAQPVLKHWPIFGLLLALTGLSTFSFASQRETNKNPSVLAAVLSILGATLFSTILVSVMDNGLFSSSNRWTPRAQWEEYTKNRCELPIATVQWMRENQIEGRLFHRSEYGGLLQQAGYNQGEVFSDTGLGKFDVPFIHELCISSERAGFIPHYLTAYHPDFALCGSFSYNWPYYLRQSGWRPIFYSPNGSVWARPGLRSDLPTVTNDEVRNCFRAELAQEGLPLDLNLQGHNICMLQSWGLGDEAAAQLKALPADFHQDSRYWEAAYLLCFTEPRATDEIRASFQQEAEKTPLRANRDFRAYALAAQGNQEAALALLDHEGMESDLGAELALDLLMQKGDWDRAQNLASEAKRFDLRNGRYYLLKAECETHFQQIKRAASDLEHALYLYPESSEVQKYAKEFADKFDDSKLKAEISDATYVYGR